MRHPTEEEMAMASSAYDRWRKKHDQLSRIERSREIFYHGYLTRLLTKKECQHPYISWHGSRGECQDCGEIVMAPDTNAILTKLFDQWHDDLSGGTE